MLKNVLVGPQANSLILVIERPYNLISGLTTKHSSGENYLYCQWNSLSTLVRSLVWVKFPHHGPAEDMDMLRQIWICHAQKSYLVRQI